MAEKNLEYLYSKKSNRLAKVVYLFFYSVSLIWMIVLSFESGTSTLEALFFPFLVVVIFEVIRRSFYYISLGTLSPKSDIGFIEQVSKLIGKKRMASVAKILSFLQIVNFHM